ncbi:serine/arginine repetitive matrix protein 1-like [Trifolium pratense]|uniref:serine/arginine repetitive matrix protein 1-like n=1 Tax=Trifolium pratense TaxID=57577 RepID=UPI001E6965D5|nr:serine/arginine repetitive matrix protein 1-like [Trifolium pratense]
MAGVNNHQVLEHMAENNVHPMDYAPYHPQDGQMASVKEDSQGGQNMNDEPYNPDEPQIPVATPPQATPAMAIPPGAPMQDIMAALVNAINRQSDMILQQNLEQHNRRLESQSRRIDAIVESRVTVLARRAQRSPTPRTVQARRAQRSPTPVRSRSFSRSRSPPPRRRTERVSPRRNEESSRNSSRRRSPRRDNPPRQQRH